MSFPDNPSFVSDVNFPEATQWNGDDSRPMPSANGRSSGKYRRIMRDRDSHDLWAALRAYRTLYGDAALMVLVDEVRHGT